RFSFGTCNNGHNRPFFTLGGLIGDDGVELAMRQACFINGKVPAEVLWIQQPFICMAFCSQDLNSLK
ncbi:hypothetical protein, partial [Pedobacter terrae]|uniref:hypothetical protein n=1 Tax=Pedobacter terrae TaxID=405671 RepID=UPI001ABF9014